MTLVVMNAGNAVAGRVASQAAKSLLQGNTVNIINAETAVITGDPRYTIKEFKQRRTRGDPYKGPFQPATPDRIFKRIVRGMMPYKKPLGKKAFKELRVYREVPEFLVQEKPVTFPEPPQGKSITLGKLAKELKQ